jgi:hypothetical protein
MVLTLSATEGEFDRLLAGAKEQFPALAMVEKVRLENAVGVRAHLNTPLGKVEAVVKLETRAG